MPRPVVRESKSPPFTGCGGSMDPDAVSLRGSAVLRLIGAVGLLLPAWWAPVQATDWFVCDCGPGADPDCIAGNDAGSNPCSADPECDGRNDRLVLRDSTVTNNHAQGWLGASNGSQILGSTFEGNGTTDAWSGATPA